MTTREHSRPIAPDRSPRSAEAPVTSARLRQLLDGWLAEEIISSEQAALMERSTAPRLESSAKEAPGRSRVRPFVVECVGYLGGVLVVVSSALIAARYWDELADGWRLTLVGAAAVALVAGGAAAGPRPTGAARRLRAALWFGSTAAVAGFLAVLVRGPLELHGTPVLTAVATGTALHAAGLWCWHRTLLQQAAAMVLLGLATSAALAQAGVPGTAPAVGAWAVGAAWAWLGWRQVLTPPGAGLVLGAAMSVVAAMPTGSSEPGSLFVMATVLAVMGVAALLRSLRLTVVGGLGLVANLPAAMTLWFPDSVIAPVVLLVAGLVVVTASTWVARRPSTSRGRAPAPPPSEST